MKKSSHLKLALRPLSASQETRTVTLVPISSSWTSELFLIHHVEDLPTVSTYRERLSFFFLLTQSELFFFSDQDAEDAVAFILTKSDYDLSRLSIGGHSAGGNLAISASSLFGSKISAVACFYPKVDFTKRENQPERKQRSGIVLSPFLSYYFGSSYLVNEEDRFNPKCSPILLEASTFPKTVFVTTGNADLLFPEGKAFIQKLKEDGHQDAVFLEIDGEGHAWEKRPNCKESQEKKEEALAGYVEAIKRGWNH